MIMSNDDEFKNSLTGNSAAISRFLRKTRENWGGVWVRNLGLFWIIQWPIFL